MAYFKYFYTEVKVLEKHCPFQFFLCHLQLLIYLSIARQ